MRPALALPLVLSLACASLLGCASLRQNIRGQELSYRGAWHCATGACEAGAMVKSMVGTREGEVMINQVALAPKAGLAFTAAAPFETLTAELIDCKGKRAPVPSQAIVEPGKHGIRDSAAQESWIIWIDPADFSGLERGAKGCTWIVEASASWADGASYSLRAGLQPK